MQAIETAKLLEAQIQKIVNDTTLPTGDLENALMEMQEIIGALQAHKEAEEDNVPDHTRVGSYGIAGFYGERY